MKTDGYTRYQCDVNKCSKKTFAIPGSDLALEYTDMRYMDANGNVHEYQLCREHATQFKAILEAHDKEFSAYISGAKLPVAAIEALGGEA